MPHLPRLRRRHDAVSFPLSTPTNAVTTKRLVDGDDFLDHVWLIDDDRDLYSPVRGGTRLRFYPDTHLGQYVVEKSQEGLVVYREDQLVEIATELHIGFGQVDTHLAEIVTKPYRRLLAARPH